MGLKPLKHEPLRVKHTSPRRNLCRVLVKCTMNLLAIRLRVLGRKKLIRVDIKRDPHHTNRSYYLNHRVDRHGHSTFRVSYARTVLLQRPTDSVVGRVVLDNLTLGLIRVNSRRIYWSEAFARCVCNNTLSCTTANRGSTYHAT